MVKNGLVEKNVFICQIQFIQKSDETATDTQIIF